MRSWLTKHRGEMTCDVLKELEHKKLKYLVDGRMDG
jgi:hypothetical protein